MKHSRRILSQSSKSTSLDVLQTPRYIVASYEHLVGRSFPRAVVSDVRFSRAVGSDVSEGGRLFPRAVVSDVRFRERSFRVKKCDSSLLLVHRRYLAPKTMCGGSCVRP